MDLQMRVYKDYAVVAKYTGNSARVSIPARWQGVPVTEIGPDAFAGNRTLEQVFLPPGLRLIGANAFRNCVKLHYLDISPEEEAQISFLPEDEQTENGERDEADEEDSEEETMRLDTLPETLQIVEANAFRGSGVRNLRFMGYDTELGDSAFRECPELYRVSVVRGGNLSMGEAVFRDSAIVFFYAPAPRMEMVPDYAFFNCQNLAFVYMKTNEVGERAFYGCRMLRKVSCGKIAVVGNEAFSGCEELKNLPAPGRRRPRRPAKKETADAAKKEGEVPVQQKTEKKMFGNQEILIRLVSKDGQDLPERFPLLPSGRWKKDHTGFVFTFVNPSYMRGQEMTALPGQMLSNISPLLQYVADKEFTTIIYGEPDAGGFCVYGMKPGAEEDIPGELFHQMLERLKQAPPDCVAEEVNYPYAMRTDREYETFLKVCGDRVPAWVRSAYQRNCGVCGLDEAKHADRAKQILMNIDWNSRWGQIPTVEEAKAMLDACFYGMEEVKIRVLEIIAQILRTGTLPKWGLLLHGPAGTGKTTIAKAIARVLSLCLIQMDMSTLGKDPEEISGTSRTYSNARPGMLLESMYRNRSSAAVLLANEIDKAGSGKGDRSVADILLTILDKTGLYENFLECCISTDNLLCIATCNDLSRVSKPLRDRFLVIHIPAYTPAEKQIIFSDYIFPQAKKNACIPQEMLQLEEKAVALLASAYATEPGVRDLEQYAERFVGDYCRQADNGKKIYTQEDVRRLLGPDGTIIRSFAIHPGEVNAAFCHEGLAKFFLVEAAVQPGSGKFEVLGPVAKIQEDYAKAAWLCVKNTANVDMSKLDVTVFIPQPVPEGADNHVGFACYAAICSRLMNSSLAVRDMCLIGGCDMNGSLYYDESDLTPLLRAMKARGVSTLYAPMGTSRLLDARVNCECGVTVIEGPDAKTLFSLAATHGNSVS